MSHTIIHYKLRIRLTFLVIGLAATILLYWFWTAAFPRGYPIPASPIIHVLFIEIILVPAVFGYTGLFQWKYSLEFDDSRLRVRTIPFPNVRRFDCAYSDIVQVKRGAMRGMLAVVPREGRTLQIAVNAFDGGASRLLKELSERVDSARIEPGLADSLWKYTWFDRIYFATAIAFCVVGLAVYYVVWGHGMICRYVAWESAGNWGVFTGVQSISLDDDGTPWVLIDIGFGEYYQVQHITSRGVQTWDLELSGDDMRWALPNGIARDGSGQPWVIYDEYLLHWTGAAWQRIPSPVGWIYGCSSAFVSSGAQIWAIAQPSKGMDAVIFGMDMTSGAARTIPLPDSAVQAGLSPRRIRLLADGSLMVLAQGKGGRSEFYLLREETWQETSYPVETSSSVRVEDFTVDQEGRIWVLGEGAYREGPRYFIGQFDSTAMIWNWSQVNTKYGPYSESYHSIEVDSRGRVWLQGSHGLDRPGNVGIWRGGVLAVFDPLPGDTARRVVRYTTTNSNYQSSTCRLLLGPDGRMWAADDRLVWIDTHAPELPRPLPDWAIEIRNPSIVFILMMVMFIVTAVSFVLTLQLQVRMK